MKPAIKLKMTFLIALALAAPAWAQWETPAVGALPNSAKKPDILQKVGIEQRLNHQVPLDTQFRDESGKTVRLGDYFGQKPVILALVYYECPMLCTQTLNGLVSALSVLKFDVGNQFQVVTLSFNPKETPKLAAEKKRTYLARYGRPGAEQGWHFLTGTETSIHALTDAVGFHYAWDPELQQFAHATAIMVLTPEGKLAQYYYGVEYSPKDLRLGLVEASQKQIGSVVDQVLLYCYHYDPTVGKYGAVVTNMLRIAGVVTILLVGGFLLLMFRGEPGRNGARQRAGAGHR